MLKGLDGVEARDSSGSMAGKLRNLRNAGTPSGQETSPGLDGLGMALGYKKEHASGSTAMCKANYPKMGELPSGFEAGCVIPVHLGMRK